MLAVLRILSALGLDAGETEEGDAFEESFLSEAAQSRSKYITRINEGIAASGL
jgi:hypothetical protein